jgi:nucleoside-triphosphatase
VKLLLTGEARAGKSTLIRRLAEAFPGMAGGIMAAEVAGPDRKRCGFEAVAVWKAPGGRLRVVERAALAAQDPAWSPRVGRYGVSEAGLALCVRAVDAAMHEGGLVIIDEIGPIQLLSAEFRDAVLRCLEGPCRLLAALSPAPDPFLEMMRRRTGVRVVEVTRSNRAHLAEGLAPWLCSE